jgi:rhomboid protease GluP
MSDYRSGQPPIGQPDGQPPRVVQVSYRPTAKHPYVTWALLGVTILFFLLQKISETLLGADLPMVLGAKINEAIYQGQVWRLITPMLLHGSLLHIAFNMYALYVIGPGLEIYYGHLRFFALYVLGAFAGNVLSLVFTEATSLGASTAIFALIAAQGIFIYRNRFLFGQRYQRMLGNIIMIVAFNLFMGLRPGIDNWGHLGGLLGGALFAWFSGPEFEVQQDIGGLTLSNKHTSADAWRALIMGGVLFSAVALVKVLFFR